MEISKYTPAFVIILTLVSALTTPLYHDRSNAAILRRDQPHPHSANTIKMPAWNYANTTTLDATADGMLGVIIEPDLVVGKPGKDGATVKKVKLGPFTIPAGKMLKRDVRNFPTPCKECFITAMQLGLEYPDGKIANVDSGAWCHHIDLIIIGQQDYTCPASLTGLIFGAVPSMGGKRIFSGGNERVPVRMNDKKKYGLEFGSRELFGGVLELMSEASKPLTVYMTMTYEYIPKNEATGYKPAEMVWLDVTNCGRESDFPSSEGIWQKESQEWVMKHNGDLVDGIGHLHDGGTKVDLFINGKLSCTSKQIYANRRGGYVEATDGSVLASRVMPPGSHISDVGVCKDWATVQKGDKLKVIAYYNDTEHMQMRNSKGRLEMQMGIMFTYLGIQS